MVLRVTTIRVDDLVAAGHASMRAGRIAEAERQFKEALTANAAHGPAHEGMGLVHLLYRRRDEAALAFMQAIQLQPTPEAYLHLGQVLSQGGKKAEGAEVLGRAAAAYPADVRVAGEYARALEQNDQYDEAVEVFESSLVRWPASQLLTYYYGALLFFQGKIARDVELYKECLKAHPDELSIHSALLFVMHFVPGMTAETLLEAHREWDQRHGVPLRRESRPFTNDRDPERPLRIGYVSPDFKNHGVGRFMAPILANHDRQKFKVFAYADGMTADAFTARIRGSVDQWRQGYGSGHAAVAEMVRADQIDILVDLTMHMPMNRMPMFARKPAPVQVTYLAYCGTTGLSAMDYRLSDPYLDVAGWESRYVEKTVRLPASWWLYEGSDLAPPVEQRPSGGEIVFGCLNNFGKVSAGALETWAAILQKVKGSRLLLHCPPGKTRDATTATLGELGITADRLEFLGRVPLPEYFALHHRMDVALDPFPYAGGTTTCDALWMGVPVVSLRGTMAVGRGSYSVLKNIGLPELAVKSRETYIKTAVTLARDAERRNDLRGVLRGLMQSSPLMDVRGFMDGLEGAYRGMWREWCAAPQQ